MDLFELLKWLLFDPFHHKQSGLEEFYDLVGYGQVGYAIIGYTTEPEDTDYVNIGSANKMILSE